jgi:hypothetical protein
MIERVELPGGRLIDREIRPDKKREVAVARVATLNPPQVDLAGFGRVRVTAVTQGLTVAVGDWVFAARVGTPNGERVVVIAKLNRLGE